MNNVLAKNIDKKILFYTFIVFTCTSLVSNNDDDEEGECCSQVKTLVKAKLPFFFVRVVVFVRDFYVSYF